MKTLAERLKRFVSRSAPTRAIPMQFCTRHGEYYREDAICPTCERGALCPHRRTV